MQDEIKIFLNDILRISSWSIFIPLLVGIVKYRTFKPVLKVLFYYIICSAIVEIISTNLGQHGINNLFLFHLFVVIEFAFLCFIYSRLLEFPTANQLFLIFTGLFTSIALTDVTFISGYKKMNELSRNIENLTLLIFSVTYFIKMLHRAESERLAALFSFWFNTAMIMYLSGSFFIFLFSNYMLDTSPDTFLAVYAIHSVFNIAFHILLAIAFTKKTI